jgi:16S rRNA processing protein RimM
MVIDMAKENYLECGKIVSTHGVRGTVRLECYCDSPKVLATLKVMYAKEKDGTFKPFRVKASSVQKNMVLCTFENIDSLDAAIPMKGTVLYADRKDFKLKKGEFFIADLLGLPVFDAETGEKYGVLADVTHPGTHDVYVIAEEDGKSFMMPAVPEFVIRVVAEGADAGIYVKLIEGMRE